MEYRPIPDERSEEFRRLVSYAFSPESGPEIEEEKKPHPGERYGLFGGERLLCVCRHYFLNARVRGKNQPVAGLSAVASPPEHRRQGHVAELLEKSLADYRERELDFTILWAFKHAFYRRYGWGTINDYAQYETSPEVLASAAGSDRGEFERVEADAWESLDSIYRASINTDFSLQRTEEWWRRRIFERWTDDPYVYRWDDDGEPQAYIVYTVNRDGEDGATTLRVTDMGSREYDGFHQLLRFLASHESQINRIVLRTAPDCPLFEIVEEPAKIECTLHAGPMFRLVDVARALERLSKPDERLSLAVSDPLAPWNDRVFSLSSEGCELTDEEVMVEMNINTLSQLYAGSHSLATLEKVGEISVREPRARPILKSLFPPRRVYLDEHF